MAGGPWQMEQALGRWSERDVVLMRLALAEAEEAARQGEVPVGAVVALEGRVLAVAHNRREQDQDPTAHAEVLAIREAARRLGCWRLLGASLYVTLEPCPLCAGALWLARISRVVYATEDPKAGAVETVFRVLREKRLNHQVAAGGGLAAEASRRLLRDFFKQRRH